MSQSNAPQANANAFLAEAPISKLLLRFSVPCVLSLLVSALYNIVDQIFIGQGVGYLGNAATTVVYPFTVIALAVALLVGDGCAALLSLSLGRGDGETARRSIGNGIVLTAIAAVVLTAVGFLFEDQILTLFGVTEACYAYARDYMTVILMGIPFYMFTSALNGAIRADGDPKYAMVSTVLGAVINLILDPVAIFLLDMGVTGAALFELCPMAIISLFGNESGLYNQYAVLCFRVYLAGILLCCIQKASSIFLQSMGKPLQSTLLSLARDVIFFVPGLVLLAPRCGVVGMLWAAPIADVLAILATAILIRREVRAIQALRQA